VVALSALSKFASSFYSNNINMKVNYDGDMINKTSLSINDKNRLLIQKTKVNFNEKDANKVSFNIEGNGTALFQV
jgi:hypothetical protein